LTYKSPKSEENRHKIKLFQPKTLQSLIFFDILRVSSGQGAIPDRWCCLSLFAKRTRAM